MKLILAFFLLPLISIGQTQYRGTIKDKRTNEPIPFATVGLMQENKGTTTSETGTFTLLASASFPDDTLIVTCLGYKVSKIKVGKTDTSHLELLLTERSFNLKEIVITNNKKSKKDILNDFDEPSYNYLGESSSIYITQIAQHFKTQSSTGQLVKVKICDGSIMHRKPARYRLRIYSMDPITKGPSTDLCSQVIEVRTKLKRNGIYTIDVEKYKIMIPDNDFFIAIEWLRIPSNYSKGEGNWVWCLPLIGRRNEKDKQLESWQLTYKNIWESGRETLLIAATVKH